MHDIRRLGLQVFAAPNNLTGEVQIQVKAREIDFVTSFGKNLKALLDILGITRMIRKENNSVLKTKTVKGELQSGDVGEGEEIPMSRYTVEEKPFDTIKIEKYRKGVSLEAISEKGYEAAVQDTDEEFKSDLQNIVTDKFYAQLKAGSLTGHETTWQMAVAMAIGKVVAKFQKMKRTATGVAVWVNTLDVYKYLGAADITLQTAFGFKYLTTYYVRSIFENYLRYTGKCINLMISETEGNYGEYYFLALTYSPSHIADALISINASIHDGDLESATSQLEQLRPQIAELLQSL